MNKTSLPDILIRLLYNNQVQDQSLLLEIKKLLNESPAISNNLTLSPLLIDCHFKIFLTDLNVEIKLHPLPKALFLLFLLHPEGIKFKELYLYKNELLNIYCQLTNKYSKAEIERAINDLVDMTKPSINQKSTRIRQAFRIHLNEEAALFYYPHGPKNQPKRIHLPQELVTIQCEILTTH